MKYDKTAVHEAPGCELQKKYPIEMQPREKVEFVDVTIEKDEIKGITFKGILDGSLLTMQSVSKQIPFILFLVFLALIYIANRYHAEKVVRRIDALKTEVKELRAEEITAASELMNLNRPSNVQQLVEDKGLSLKISDEPPLVIYKN
jgi:hypothetical protein